VILYQHIASTLPQENHIQTINTFLSQHLLNPSLKTISLDTRPASIADFLSLENEMIVVLYPKVVAAHANMTWIPYFMKELWKEYRLFQKSMTHNSNGNDNIDESSMFDATLKAIYEKAQVVGKVEFQTKSQNNPAKDKAASSKKGKEARVWHDGEQEVTSASMAKLDRSKNDSSSGTGAGSDPMEIAENSPALMEARAAYLPAENEVPTWEEEDQLRLVDDENIDDESGAGWGGSLKGMMDQISGKVLRQEDLEQPLKEMENMLAGKNVARDIAQEICENVKAKLIGKKMTSFTRVKTAVRQALEVAIERILKPGMGRGGSDSVDVLRDVVSKRERGGGFFGKKEKKSPFVIVMVGINGVGKSTSLAKIAYYLKSNGCNPLIAACDTFRSGAVEQLNVHAKCLNVPLFHKGYAKDPAVVAKAAIEHGTQEGHDVVLVDTAGRMQNNVPLMKALSNLVVQNNPDLVLFVCEALVGNDGMDQLEMFNKALRNGGHARKIDGIILTKFDTVSDKVGAALTMTHVTGSPVVFCGTGQKYNHLKKLSVQSVIKSLFS
jgi:signal recognition particle receptor subunit alpha